MATVLREINAEITNFAYEFIPNAMPPKILAKGEVAKQIFYVTNDGFVRHQNTVTPFSATIELPGLFPGLELNVNAEIEHISPRLINEGSQVEQQILITVNVSTPFRGLIANRQFLFQSTELLDEPKIEVTKLTTEWFLPESVNQFSEPAQLPEVPLFADISSLMQEQLYALENRLRWELEQSLRSELRAEMDMELKIQIEKAKARLKEDERQAELAKQYKLEQEREILRKRSIEQSIHGFKSKC